MRTLLAYAIFTMCVSHTFSARAEKIPIIEQGIYQPAPPFENIKQSFYVRERERPLLGPITDASTSIARFLIAVSYKPMVIPTPAIPQVLAEGSSALRLPPIASAAKNSRYVGSILYCWKSDKPGNLEFLIEWGDITTNARYTDSYIFVKRESSWYFEKHGKIAPWHWKQNKRYFQRDCPSIVPEDSSHK